jgi:hypothetical protein
VSPATASTGTEPPVENAATARPASINASLRDILHQLGGASPSPDEPAGMIAARIVDRLHGGPADESLPEVLSLVPLGRWLADMVAFFGGHPVSEMTQPVAAQLLGVLRGTDGISESRLDNRYLGEILRDIAVELAHRWPSGAPGDSQT